MPTNKATAATDITSMPGLKKLRAETNGSLDVLIAVLDGPVDLAHPCFSGAKLRTISQDEADTSGTAAQHGTHVTSIIFGQPTEAEDSVQGIAPRCSGLLVPIFDNREDGSIIPCSEIRLATAILDTLREAEQMFPENRESLPLIINISGGQFSRTGKGHPLLQEAVQKCADKNVLIVSAAGNDGCDCLHVPGSLPSVLAVGGMDEQGVPLEMSNWGSAYQSQGILAPGQNIPGARPGGGFTVSSGTSFAAPIVSGVAALLLSLQIKSGQQANPQLVREAILNSAVKCDQQTSSDCHLYLAGVLNIEGAVSIIKQGGNFMSDVITDQVEVQPSTAADSVAVSPAAQVPSAGAAMNIAPVAAEMGPEGIMMSQEPAKPGCKDIGCGKEKWSTKFVYALGTLGVDFVNQARQDSLQFHSDGDKDGNPLPITLPINLARYLHGWNERYMVGDKKKTFEHKPNMYDAKSIYWTLWQNGTPIYVIQPMGPFAEDAYRELVDFYAGQIGFPLDIDYTGTPQQQKQTEPDAPEPILPVEHVAISGVIVGEARISTNEVVPVIVPHMRGTAAWSIEHLINQLCNTCFKGMDPETIRQIILRMYEETKNFGVMPEDRAINYAAVNVFELLISAKGLPKLPKDEKWEFDSVTASRSQICRIDSECYDVEFSFYNPENLNRARIVNVVTVDVSDVVPVMIGNSRSFSRR